MASIAVCFVKPPWTVSCVVLVCVPTATIVIQLPNNGLRRWSNYLGSYHQDEAPGFFECGFNFVWINLQQWNIYVIWYINFQNSEEFPYSSILSFVMVIPVYISSNIGSGCTFFSTSSWALSLFKFLNHRIVTRMSWSCNVVFVHIFHVSWPFSFHCWKIAYLCSLSN